MLLFVGLQAASQVSRAHRTAPARQVLFPYKIYLAGKLNVKQNLSAFNFCLTAAGVEVSATYFQLLASQSTNRYCFLK
jgi:hypothetical protein